VISTRLRDLVHSRREEEFNSFDGVLVSRKKRWNQVNSCIEVLSVYINCEADGRCRDLSFMLFNQTTKQFAYLGKYSKFQELKKFHVQDLAEACRQVLDQVEFEQPPFMKHLVTLQEVLKQIRSQMMPLFSQ